MSAWVVIGHAGAAEEVRLKRAKLQQEYLVGLEEAVVAIKSEAGEDQTEPESSRVSQRGRLGERLPRFIPKIRRSWLYQALGKKSLLVVHDMPLYPISV